MTAYFIAKTSDRVSILSDRSQYREDGRLADVDRKVTVIPAWQGAVFSTGPVMTSVIGTGAACLYGSLDEFIAESDWVIERAVNESIADPRYGFHHEAYLFAAGWSDAAGRPQVWLMATGEKIAAAGGIAPFVWQMLPDGQEFASAPATLGQYPDLMAWLGTKRARPGVDYSARQFDPAAHGAPLFDAYRQIKPDSAFHSGGATCLVGGGIDLTVIDRAGVRQECIHTWPDQIGEYIRPAPLPVSAWQPASAPMNRAERRRARAMTRA